ncbi:unnamed protein product [Rotaria sp. Silwood1]|nr:unnamed protein product [Rotaria sp. Silwood1]
MSNTPIITFSQSNKGKRVIICDGFVYQLNKSCPEVKYWRCENRLCSAVLHTDANDQFKARKGDHSSHLPSPEHIEILNFNANVKERVTTEAIPIARIYDEELAKAQLSQTALCIVPLAQDASFPCVFVLLTGRSNPMYKDVFKQLEEEAKRLQMNFLPDQITTDFEKALVKPLQKQFPNARHIGCFYHYTQAIYRKIQNLGLSNIYKDDVNVRNMCRRLMALPLLPLNEVEFAFEELTEQRPDVLMPLFEYFDNFWMKTTSMYLWNVSDLKIRTNNNCEGWHNRFNHRVDKVHPNIWHFIDVLKKEEVHFQQQLLHAKSGIIQRLNYIKNLGADLIWICPIFKSANDVNIFHPISKITIGFYSTMSKIQKMSTLPKVR